MDTAAKIEGYVLSPQQRRVFSLDTGGTVGPFVAQIRLVIQGRVDRARLQRALECLVGRHEILRTQFARQQQLNIRLQVINSAARVSVAEEGIALLQELEAAGTNFPITGFDLTGGEPLKVLLVEVSETQYELFLMLPVVCADAASLNSLVRELVTMYDSDSAIPVDDPVVQYADIAEHFNELLQSDFGALGRQYWHPRLEALEAPNLRGAHAAEAKSFQPQAVYEQLSRRILEGVMLAAGLEPPAEQVILLTCWQALLQQISQGDEFVIGFAADGREIRDIANAIGLFERYVPLRVNGFANSSFRELLTRTAENIGEALKWQRSFQWPDDERFHAVCFSYYDASWVLNISGQKAQCRALNVCSDRFELKLSCTTLQSEISLNLSFDPAVYPASTAQRLLAQFVTLVAGIGTDVDMPVHRLDCLSPWERQLLLREYAISSGQPVVLRDIVLAFEEHAKNAPDATALKCEGQELTYSQLDQISNQLGRHLKNLNAGSETQIALCVQRSPAMVIGLLGILKTGAAYVPLDPDLPPERLSYMLEDSGAGILLTQENLRKNFQATLVVECLDTWMEKIKVLESSALQVTREQDSPAYVIYTSGSTGRPKGVVVTHGGLQNHMAWMQQQFPLANNDCVLQKTNFSFDASVWEFWAPLMAGATLVLARPGGQQDAEYMVRCIQENQITTLQLVPLQLRMLLEQREFEKCRTLKRVYCGGEALTQDLVEEFYRCLPGATLYNLYGPTEATIDATFSECTPGQRGFTANIGKPVANTYAYVLRESGELAPVGAPGELYIGGVGLARGYINRPELTAERFVPNPFSEAPGTRLYRTGDVVRWQAEGQLEYLGRQDHQVKLRGYRIELGEIEAVLEQHPQVSRAVVIVHQREGGEKRLVGYVVKQMLAYLHMAALRAYLEERLPEYMVPGVLMDLEELPMMANGKINRKALPEPIENQIAGKAPQTVTEELLAAIWEQLLKRERISRDASFFDLGGHSLLATQVVSRVRNIFNVDLPLKIIFERPTVAGLSEEIEKLCSMPSTTNVGPIERVDRNQLLPLSHAQERLWFIDQLEPGNIAYNVPFGLRLRGKLNRVALQRSIDEIIQRHEVLRTIFPATDGVPVQEISADCRLLLQEIDLRNSAPEITKSELRRVIREIAEQPFDLSTGPLLRARLVQSGDEEYVLLVVMHHIVSDGWSAGVMTRELGALYEAYRNHRSPVLPELPIQYADYAIWQRRWLQGEVLEGQIQYWKKQLAGIKPLALPSDRLQGQGGTLSHNAGIVFFEFDENLAEKLKELARNEGVTMFMLLLAAFQVVLGIQADQDDVAIGTDIANRNRQEIENLVGFFVNQLVLRTDLSGDITFSELLKRVRKVTLEAYQHQDAPFEKVVEEVTSGRSADAPPLFKTKFVLQNAHAETVTMTALQLEVLEFEQKIAKFDLMLTISVQDTGMGGAIEYRKDLFNQNTARLIQSQFRQVVLDITNQPAIPLSALKQKLKASQASHRAAQQAEAKRIAARELLSIKRQEASLV